MIVNVGRKPENAARASRHTPFWLADCAALMYNGSDMRSRALSAPPIRFGGVRASPMGVGSGICLEEGDNEGAPFLASGRNR